MLPHLLEILLVGQEAIQSYYLPVQMILIFNGSPLVIKQWGVQANSNPQVTLPIAYSSFYTVVAGLLDTIFGNTRIGVESKSNSQFSAIYRAQDGATHKPNGSFAWIACGK